ncbi:MAG: response regulator [Bryobacteraceae bacterium]
MNRILLADDSPQALRLAEQILNTRESQVVSVTDGATALHRLVDFDPDLFICDVYLPTKNAFELARYLKAQPMHRRVRIVFAAGPADRFDEQDARNAGADAIIRKPFEASALLSAIGPLLSEARAERGEEDTSPSPVFNRPIVRSAVTLALETAMPVLINEITDRVLLALAQERVSKPATPVAEPQAATAAGVSGAKGTS